MNRVVRPSTALLRLASFQAGVVTKEQAVAFGVGRHTVHRLVDQGAWTRMGPAVYFTHDVEPPWSAWAWGGVLRGGDGARLGGTAAGFLHGIAPDAPMPIPVLVPHSRSLTDLWPWVFSRERPGVRSADGRGSPPRLSVEDTVLDLVEGGSETAAVAWVTTAVQSRRTTPQRLLRALDRRTRCRHRGLLRVILADVAEGAESPLELAYLREVERRHVLPRGRRQQRSGQAVRDVLYEDQQLIVELDGRLGHDGTGRFRDMWRDNTAAVSGGATLRYGWRDVIDRPCVVAWQVAQVLGVRGWPGLLTPCRRCQDVRWS